MIYHLWMSEYDVLSSVINEEDPHTKQQLSFFFSTSFPEPLSGAGQHQ